MLCFVGIPAGVVDFQWLERVNAEFPILGNLERRASSRPGWLPMRDGGGGRPRPVFAMLRVGKPVFARLRLGVQVSELT